MSKGEWRLFFVSLILVLPTLSSSSPVLQSQAIPRTKKPIAERKQRSFDSYALYEKYHEYLNATPRNLTSFFAFRFETNRKKIALTIDDGPTENTARLVQILKKYNVPATFFVICENIDHRSAILYQSNLIEVGMHSYAHDNYQYFSEEAILQDIDQCHSQFSKYGLSTTYFRPPYGIITRGLVKALKKKRLLGIIWSVDSLDWLSNEGGGGKLQTSC